MGESGWDQNYSHAHYGFNHSRQEPILKELDERWKIKLVDNFVIFKPRQLSSRVTGPFSFWLFRLVHLNLGQSRVSSFIDQLKKRSQWLLTVHANGFLG